MANNWTDMDTAQQDRVRNRFLRLHEARQVADALPEIGIATLYRYAKDKDIDRAGAIERGLAQDDLLWSDFLNVLDMIQARDFRQLAAASSEDIRGGWDLAQQWQYQVRQSPEPPYEEVLIIDISDADAYPTRLVAESDALELRLDQKLESPFEGTIQMILAEGDTLAKVLAAEDVKVKMW